ncbi:MAG: carboxypeptidase-like regulatory domain-containing protein [Paludibacteraceae bacterium]
MKIRRTFTFLLIIFAWNVCAGQVSPTGFSGITLDAETGDTIPFVQMLFIGSSIGTTSDMDGHFTLSNTQGLTTVQASMVGYKSALVNLRLGHFQKNYVLRLEPDVYGLQEVVVAPTPKRRERYSRKDNPAVELVKNVIAHKQDNRLEAAPKLFIPNSNQSLFMTPNTFNMMKPMEFAMDRYVAWYMTYYLKGWIFNRIPGWNKLKLREVVSFSGIYGGLSAKNNPDLSGWGLYGLPDGCSPMGKVPYMELTAGVENIFKFLRVNYVRRLNYNAALTGWQKNGIRFTFRFSL